MKRRTRHTAGKNKIEDEVNFEDANKKFDQQPIRTSRSTKQAADRLEKLNKPIISRKQTRNSHESKSAKALETKKKNEIRDVKGERKITDGGEYSQLADKACDDDITASGDDFLLSQVPKSEVGWDCAIEVTDGHQPGPDISDILKNFDSDKKGIDGNDKPPSTPPLLGLWMESPGEERSTRFHHVHGKHNSRRHGPRGSGALKEGDTNQMLKNLGVVLKEAEEEQNKTDLENKTDEDGTGPRRSARLQGTGDFPHPSNMQAVDPKNSSFDLFDPTQKGRILGHSSPGTLQGSPSPMKSIMGFSHKQLSLISAHSSPLHRAVAAKPQSPLVGATHNQSTDDLWTDEEFFENDSFLQVTQSIVDAARVTPRHCKRKSFESPESVLPVKTGRFTFALNTPVKPAPFTSIIQTEVVQEKSLSVPVKEDVSRMTRSQTTGATLPDEPVKMPSSYRKEANPSKSHSIVVPQTKATTSKNYSVNLTTASNTVMSSTISTQTKTSASKFFNTSIVAKEVKKVSPNKVHKAYGRSATMNVRDRIQAAFKKAQNSPHKVVLVQHNTTTFDAPPATDKTDNADLWDSDFDQAVEDTSITDDLLATLVEPDLLLESQAFSDAIELTPPVVIASGSSTASLSLLGSTDKEDKDITDVFGTTQVLEFLEEDKGFEKMETKANQGPHNRYASELNVDVAETTIPSKTTQTVTHICASKPADLNQVQTTSHSSIRSNHQSKVTIPVPERQGTLISSSTSSNSVIAKCTYLKTLEPSPTGSIVSTCSSTSSEGRYSSVDIEKKRQEALKKRLNRLKLRKK